MNETETTPIVRLIEPGTGLGKAAILVKPKMEGHNEKVGCAKCYA